MAWHPSPTPKLLGITEQRTTALQLVLACVLPVLGKRLGLNLSNLLSDQSEGVPTDLGDFGFPCSAGSAGFSMLSTLFAMPCRPSLGHTSSNTVCRQPFSCYSGPGYGDRPARRRTKRRTWKFRADGDAFELGDWLAAWPFCSNDTIEKTRCVWSLFLKVLSVPSRHPLPV